MKRIVICLLLMLVPSSAFADLNLGTEDIGRKGDSEAWVMLEKLSEAEDMIEAGDISGARLALEALLKRYPEYKVAKYLYANLGKDAHSGGEMQKGEREKADAANRLWQDFQGLKEAGKCSEARAKLTEIGNLYKRGGFKPPFLSGYETELARAERCVEKGLEGEFKKIEEGLAAPRVVEGSAERAVRLVALYEVLRSVLQRGGGLAKAEYLNGQVIRELSRSARVLFAKGRTLKELDDCDAAAAEFQKLIGLLKYRELEFYGRAEKELEACEK